MNIISKQIDIGGRTLTLEIGRFAHQATSAVLARYGDTMVLSTVVASPEESTLSYFPLIVEYVERLYAGGRIKGSRWVKREGRPSDDALLKARLIDRSIRPLFNKHFHHDVQVIVTVLSVDGENEPDILGIIATSCALSISSIPWNGPIGAVRVGYIPPKNGNSGFFANPGIKEEEFSEADLVVSATEDKVIMLEAGTNNLAEETILSGIEFGKKEILKIITCIKKLVKEAGKDKITVVESAPSDKLTSAILKNYKQFLEKIILYRASKIDNGEDLKLLSETVYQKYGQIYEKKEIDWALEALVKKKIREDIINNKKRPDGRGLTDIRKIEIETGLLPRTHGSAVFKRGQTQVLTVATLGSPSLEQLIESPEGETAKRYIHHYSMPPYSVGETGRLGFPSRREIGHGALTERSLLPEIPSQEKFPYTIRLVSEVLSSNGSTSMASTCGSTLALMDAGVPIKNSVAGISIGLVNEGNKYVLLTDILGLEDFCGDMDFKVAGTKIGITAIQLDVKIDGLTDKIIKEALIQAKEARLYILEKMLLVIPAPKSTLSQYAPRVIMLNIPLEKIGEVVGPGGKIIRQIITKTGCDINIKDNGEVTISGSDPEKVTLAKNWISGIIKEVNPDEIYQGTVKRILPFGAFVEILPGKEGLVHVSQMSDKFISSPEQVVSIGQAVKVRVVKIDEQNRINLSMLLDKRAVKRRVAPYQPPRPPRFSRYKRRF